MSKMQQTATTDSHRQPQTAMKTAMKRKASQDQQLNTISGAKHFLMPVI